MFKRNNFVCFLRWKWMACMVVLAAAAFPASLSGQEARAAAASPLAVFTPPPEPDDPAYDLYRQGYALVLSEQWDKARAKFAELRKQFPSSAYLDDAAYWTAVSWRRIDRDKAAKLYRALLREFPQSPYMDDAVADLRLLEVEAELARTPGQYQMLKEQQEIRIGISRELEYLQQDLQRLQEAQQIKFRNRLKVIGEGDTLVIRTVPPMPPRTMHSPAGLDKEIRTRVEALQMLSIEVGNKQAQEALREIALDVQQPVEMRVTAVRELGHVTDAKTADVLLEVARVDPNSDVQRAAIQVYAQSAANKKRAVDNLVDLFKRLDVSGTARDPRLATTLYSIASIGDERATGFLEDIARSHRDEDMRSAAVFYLGTIGTEPARTALIRLMRGE